ncbi:hypothetical protein ILYODFUR_029298, partial [Ilyodon furcidens]
PSAACFGRTYFLRSNCGSSTRSTWKVPWSCSEFCYKMAANWITVRLKEKKGSRSFKTPSTVVMATQWTWTQLWRHLYLT